MTVDGLIAGLLNHYITNGKRSLKWVKIKVNKHLLPYFAGKRAHEVSTADIQAFTKQRQEAGASNGEINRELALLKRSYNLALQADLITKKPYIPLLQERNVRHGFFELREFEAVLAHLPEALRPPMSFAYYTGWRIASEILKLTWSQVDLETGTVRLEAHTTKNDDARPIYLPQLLVDLLDQQWQQHLSHYPTCPHVFHRSGKPIISYAKDWKKAVTDAGLVGKIPHDFRRTAVRNLVRAGVPERVAMTITGHKTRSVFERYNIVSDGDLKEAVRKLENTIANSTATTLATHPTSLPTNPLN
ncbi:MAG: site-specific integrase [Deltaproteobacteria bacterium]|nr:site-specific integrase [Deltaproteobacteria bacterium]